MNWSLMLNALLLIGVVIAIVRTLQSRRYQVPHKILKNVPDTGTAPNTSDDIISVRKVDQASQPPPTMKPTITSFRASASTAQIKGATHPKISSTAPILTSRQPNNKQPFVATADTLMIFLLAKSQRQLAGYELLQAILSAGFRFGEGGLFHRHQFPNCQGPIMCSLAAATPTGTFDLQNIGGFVVHGLCLYMQLSDHQEIDAERFDMMLDTARALSDNLDTHLLDDLRQPLSDQSITRYHRRLLISDQPETVE